MSDASDLWNNLKIFFVLDEIEDGIFHLYETMSLWIQEEQYDKCEIIFNMDFEDMPIVYILGILSITHDTSKLLQSRSKYYDKFSLHLKSLDPDRAEDLLRGFK